jgi:hypothetical protein
MKTTAAAISVLAIVVASAIAGYVGYQDLNGSGAVRSVQLTTITEISTVTQTGNASTVNLPGQTVTTTVAAETVTVTELETTTVTT